MGRRETCLGKRRLRDLLLVDDCSQGGCQLTEVLGFFVFLGMLFCSLVYQKLVSRSRARKDYCAFVLPLLVLRYMCIRTGS